MTPDRTDSAFSSIEEISFTSETVESKMGRCGYPRGSERGRGIEENVLGVICGSRTVVWDSRGLAIIVDSAENER